MPGNYAVNPFIHGNFMPTMPHFQNFGMNPMNMHNIPSTYVPNILPSNAGTSQQNNSVVPYVNKTSDSNLNYNSSGQNNPNGFQR